MPAQNRFDRASVAQATAEAFQDHVVKDAHLFQLLTGLFPERETAERLAKVFEARVRETIAARSPELIESDRQRIHDPAWLLDEVQYMGYVNFIGEKSGQGTFDTLQNHSRYMMNDLGAAVFYALPFLSSPFGDAGFDVSNYRDVDARFGGLKAFRSFREAWAAQGGKFQMDLVLNHVSSEHEWAKKALAGDPAYRAYFHIRDQAPNVLKVTEDATGLPLFAQYLERDSQGVERSIERRVVFPAFANPKHPHYTKVQDANGQDLWVYHTFYPFQWDLNFSNPSMIDEVLAVLGFWANEGADVLRLDAIPHLFKERESDPRIMITVELLRYFLAKAAPRTSLLVEANQSPEVIQKYFGQTTNFRVEHLEQILSTSSGAQVAYNFDQAIHSWASLLSGDKSYLLEGLRRTPEAPPHTLWAYFLRIHDELSLSKAPDSVREVIQRELMDSGLGAPFRGARGVGGRMANFLSHDVRRQKLAFAHLLSLHGHPVLYYGDEIMAVSDPAYAQAAAHARGGAYDSRDEGRGPIGIEQFQAALMAGSRSPAGDVLATLRHLIAVRQQRVSLRRGRMKVVSTSHPGVVAYSRSVMGQESTLVVLNLTGEVVSTRIDIGLTDAGLFDLISERVVEVRGVNGASGGFELRLAEFEALWLAL